MQSMLDLNFDDLSPSLFVQLHTGSDHDKDTFLLFFLCFKKRLPTKQYVILKVMVHFYS